MKGSRSVVSAVIAGALAAMPFVQVEGEFFLQDAPDVSPCTLPVAPVSGQYVLSEEGAYRAIHEFKTEHCGEPWSQLDGEREDSGRYELFSDTVHFLGAEGNKEKLAGLGVLRGDTLWILDEAGALRYVRGVH